MPNTVWTTIYEKTWTGDPNADRNNAPNSPIGLPPVSIGTELGTFLDVAGFNWDVGNGSIRSYTANQDKPARLYIPDTDGVFPRYARLTVNGQGGDRLNGLARLFFGDNLVSISTEVVGGSDQCLIKINNGAALFSIDPSIYSGGSVVTRLTVYSPDEFNPETKVIVELANVSTPNNFTVSFETTMSQMYGGLRYIELPDYFTNISYLKLETTGESYVPQDLVKLSQEGWLPGTSDRLGWCGITESSPGTGSFGIDQVAIGINSKIGIIFPGVFGTEIPYLTTGYDVKASITFSDSTTPIPFIFDKTGEYVNDTSVDGKTRTVRPGEFAVGVIDLVATKGRPTIDGEIISITYYFEGDYFPAGNGIRCDRVNTSRNPANGVDFTEVGNPTWSSTSLWGDGNGDYPMPLGIVYIPAEGEPERVTVSLLGDSNSRVEGWIVKGLQAANIGYLNLALHGESAYNLAQSYGYRRAIASLARFQINALGTNDTRTNPNDASSLLSILSKLRQPVPTLSGFSPNPQLEFIQATILPQTLSTDNFTTLANQSYVNSNGVPGGTISLVNTAIRALEDVLIADINSVLGADVESTKWAVIDPNGQGVGIATTGDGIHVGGIANDLGGSAIPVEAMELIVNPPVDSTAPTLTSVTIAEDGQTTTFVFTEVDSTPMLPSTNLTGLSTNGGRTWSGFVRTNPTTYTATLSTPSYEGQTVLVNYSSSTGNIKDSTLR